MTLIRNMKGKEFTEQGPDPDSLSSDHINLLLPSGIGDLYWCLRKLLPLCREEPVKLWFPKGEMHRAGALASMFGIESGYLQGLQTKWVWDRPGAPEIPPVGGWASVQVNRLLEAGRHISLWYPKLPLVSARPSVTMECPLKGDFCVIHTGADDYMEGNLTGYQWGQIGKGVQRETGLYPLYVGAAYDKALMEEAVSVSQTPLQPLYNAPLELVLAHLLKAHCAVGIAGGITIMGVALGVPTLLGYPKWLHRMPGTWEPEECIRSSCILGEMPDLVRGRVRALVGNRDSSGQLAVPALRVPSDEMEPIRELPPAGSICPLCGGKGSPVGYKADYALRECAEGHAPILLSWQWASVAEMEAFYAKSEFHTTHQTETNQRADDWGRDEEALIAAEARVSLIEAFYKQQYPRLYTWCDLGAGTGALVKVANDHGFCASGIEASEPVVEEAQSRGRNLICDNLEKMDRWGPCDVFTCVDVFEHLLYPEKFLETVASNMIAGKSVLYVEMPEWKSGTEFDEGLDCRHVRPLEHLCLYSVDAFLELALKAGLEVDAIVRPKRGSLSKVVYLLRKRGE